MRQTIAKKFNEMGTANKSEKLPFGNCRIFEKIGAWKFSFQTTVPTSTGAFLSPKSNVTVELAKQGSIAAHWKYVANVTG